MRRILNDKRCRLATLTALFVGWLLVGPVQTAGAEEGAPPAAPSTQRRFATPEAAVDALLEALKKEDEGTLLDIFGQEHEKLVVVTDKVARHEAFTQLCTAARAKKELQKEGDVKRILVLGNEAWPFPIPLVKEESGWRFDTAAGAEEIINRRIGENELEAIATCRAYVQAQVDYAGKDRDGDEVLEYAQRIRSTKGKKDGLYWEVAPDGNEEVSPFGPLMAEAAAYLVAGKKGETPYRGYYYKMLTRQGANPPGGKYDYVINGHMIAGFALVGCPAAS